MKLVARCLGVAVLAVCSACASPITFAKRPEPSALRGLSKLELMPLAYDNLQVGKKSEADYIASKKDEGADKWAANKQVWAEDVANMIAVALKGAHAETERLPAGKTASEGIVLSMNVAFIEPGFYVGVASEPATVRVHNVITDMSNKAVLYEFNTVATASGFSDGQRIREAMLASGNIIGNFLAGEIR